MDALDPQFGSSHFVITRDRSVWPVGGSGPAFSRR